MENNNKKRKLNNIDYENNNDNDDNKIIKIGLEKKDQENEFENIQYILWKNKTKEIKYNENDDVNVMDVHLYDLHFEKEENVQQILKKININIDLPEEIEYNNDPILLQNVESYLSKIKNEIEKKYVGIKIAKIGRLCLLCKNRFGDLNHKKNSCQRR